MNLSLGRAHELGMCASVTASILIVLLGGEFPPWVWLVTFAPLVSMMMRNRGVSVPGFSGTLLGVAAIGAGVATLLRGGIESAVFAGGATMLGVTAARMLTRSTLAHDFQSIALSLVLVLAGSVLNVGISYILVFVAYAISTVWALATRQLIAGAAQTGASEKKTRERDDVITPLFFVGSGAVSLGVLGAAVLVFVSFPRIGFGELGFLAKKESKLPSSVGFASDPRGLSTSTDIVARVRGVTLEQFGKGLYLRGIVYDQLTLDAFSQSDPDAINAKVVDTRPTLRGLAHRPEQATRYEVTLNPLGGDLLFVLGHVRVAQAVQGGAFNPNRSIIVGGSDRHDELKATAPLVSAMRYMITGFIAAPGEVSEPRDDPPRLKDRQRYLDAPASTPAIERALAEALGPDASQLDEVTKVNRLRQWFRTRFTYSLDPGLAGRDQALNAFLDDVRAGHCELFAGGFALMLRKTGIPARVVGGFQGGALADDSSIVFQQRHAHAWVEWWSEGRGWIVDDATPEYSETREELTGVSSVVDLFRRFWDERVVDYSLTDQQAAISGVMRTLRGHNLGKISKALFATGFVVAVVVLIARRFLRNKKSGARVDKLAFEIVAACDRLRGEPHPTTSTLREIVAGLEPAVLRRALSLYERSRFGGVVVDEAEVKVLVLELRALKVPSEKRDEGASSRA